MSEERDQEYRSINLKCPICQAEKIITIPEKVFAQKKFGSIKIQVPIGAVCPDHHFIVFLDPKGIVRGYEKIDILMSAPTEDSKKIEERTLTLKKLIEIFGMYGLFSLLHAKLFGYHTYIIRNTSKDGFLEQLNTYFDEITDNKHTKKNLIEIIKETDYNETFPEHKNSLVIDTDNNIIQTPWEDKLDLEESFIKKAFEIIDEEEQKILLKQDLTSFLKEVEQTIKILKDTEEIYDSKLIEQLSKDLKIQKINKARLNSIRQFIARNVNEELVKKIKNRVKEFLDFL